MTDKNEPAPPDGQQPIINIVGERVALGPLRRDLVPLYFKWVNDFEVNRFVGSMRPMTLETQQDWYANASKAENDAHFAIYEGAQLRPIGLASLSPINNVHLAAEYFITIGDKESWDKGFGTEVTRLMLDYGFTCLGLHNINLWVYSTNARAIKAYRRVGFRMSGRLRQSVRLGGRACDLILMDCLATEVQGGASKHLLPEPSEVNE